MTTPDDADEDLLAELRRLFARADALRPAPGRERTRADAATAAEGPGEPPSRRPGAPAGP